MGRVTVITTDEFEVKKAEVLEEGGTYRILQDLGGGRERRAFAWNTKKGIIHADYIYRKPATLNEAIADYGEEKVYRLFCDSLSTESDSNAIRPRTGRSTKAEVRAETIRELFQKGVIDEATCEMLLEANKKKVTDITA